MVAKLILDELDRHPTSWRGTRAAAEALEALSDIIEDELELSRFAFHLVGISLSKDPEEEGSDLAMTALNSTRGIAAQAATKTVARLAEDRHIPAELASTLQRLAADVNAGVRFAIIRFLPQLQQADPDLGWLLFALATQGANASIWAEAESCLYHAYHHDFDKVDPYLALMYEAGAYDSWAHIVCLAYLSGHVSAAHIKTSLEGIEDESAWAGAARVFATNAGLAEHRAACLEMIEWVLQHAPSSTVVASEVDHRLFDAESAPHYVSQTLLRAMFVYRSRINPAQQTVATSFFEWLAANAVDAPDETLLAIETMLDDLAWSEEGTLFFQPSIFSALFQEAEEREESDSGEFLRRVVAVHDTLLRSGGDTFYNWLKDAERP